MKSVLRLVPAAILVAALVGSIAGCSSGEETACEQAMASVPKIEAVDGLSTIVSGDLARTLGSCDSPDSWRDALQANPDVVDLEALDDSTAMEYFLIACEIAKDQDIPQAIC